MEFSRQEYWSGLPFPSPEDLPDPGIEPRSPLLQGDSLPSEPPEKPKAATEKQEHSLRTRWADQVLYSLAFGLRLFCTVELPREFFKNPNAPAVSDTS